MLGTPPKIQKGVHLRERPSLLRLQEVLPVLLSAVGQAVRPVAPHLFTPGERDTMARMNQLLLDHGATLALTGPDAAPVEGHPDITLLSPPLHRLVLFKVRLHCLQRRQTYNMIF